MKNTLRELRKRVEEKLEEPSFKSRLRLISKEQRERLVKEIMKELLDDWLVYSQGIK